jgi:integrase
LELKGSNVASISTNASGVRRIVFNAAADAGRRTIYLGKAPQRTAETVKGYVEKIVEAQAHQVAVDADTTRWLTEIPDKLHKKLSGVGLVPARRQQAGGPTTLGAFLDAYIKERGDVKGSTATVYGHTRRNLVEYFGERKPLATINEGDADAFRLFLIAGKLAKNTVNKRCQIAMQFFKAAARKRLVRPNPFADIKGGTIKANRDRDYFITPQDAAAVTLACPDAEWRLIVALSRYGGLRCPSEHLALRWDGIDWDKKRITVYSPKTEHQPGGESRIIPMFPELETALGEVFDRPGPAKSEFVITRYRGPATNLRTQFLKIIRRAGLKPWPRLFHNLTASRETELMQTHPIHVVCEWLGNSRLIAQEHYLRVTETDFEAATRIVKKNDAQDDARSAPNGIKCDKGEAQEMPESPEKTRISGDSGGMPDGRYLEPGCT